MSLLNTAGTIAIWWRVIFPFAIIGLILTLFGINILTTPKQKGYKVTKGIVETVKISQSEPKTYKNSSNIYYDFTYSMTVQFTNKKTNELITSPLTTTTQSPGSYSVGSSINIEYDKNNCSVDDCHIVMGNTMTKNSMGGIFTAVGVVCVIIALGAFMHRKNKNLQGVVLIRGTFGAGNRVIGKLFGN